MGISESAINTLIMLVAGIIVNNYRIENIIKEFINNILKDKDAYNCVKSDRININCNESNAVSYTNYCCRIEKEFKKFKDKILQFTSTIDKSIKAKKIGERINEFKLPSTIEDRDRGRKERRIDRESGREDRWRSRITTDTRKRDKSKRKKAKASESESESESITKNPSTEPDLKYVYGKSLVALDEDENDNDEYMKAGKNKKTKKKKNTKKKNKKKRKTQKRKSKKKEKHKKK
jgi:hypothetical protein